MQNKITGQDDRWGAAGSFGKWLHVKLTQAGLSPDTPFVYLDKVTRKKYAMDAETIVSVILDAGERPEYAQAIYDLIKAAERKGRSMKEIVEQMGRKLVASGFFQKDPSTRMENFTIQ